jgi:hypothetical protein
MPGSWEVTHNGTVLCGILHTEVTTIAWSLGFRNLQIPGQVMMLTGMPFDHARNVACMRAIESGADWLFFLDSDVIAPDDAIHKLMAHNRPVVSGMYCRRSEPIGVPVAIKNGTWLNNFRLGDTVEVDLVGAGCLLIHRELLQKIPPQRHGKHWFDWRVDLKGVPGMGEGDCLSEDFTFCSWCRKHGVPILLDTSIVCKHVGYSEAVLGGFQPLHS